MPVQAVHLVLRHEVDHTLHLLLAEEMTAVVDEEPAPFVLGRVLDLNAWIRLLLRLRLDAPELRQRHARVERARGVGAAHRHTVLRDGNLVPLWRNGRHCLELGSALRSAFAAGNGHLARRRHNGQTVRRDGGACGRTRGADNEQGLLNCFHGGNNTISRPAAQVVTAASSPRR